jgi:hypothetical protein
MVMTVAAVWDDSSLGFSQVGGNLRTSCAFAEPQFTIRASQQRLNPTGTFHKVDLNLDQVVI